MSNYNGYNTVIPTCEQLAKIYEENNNIYNLIPNQYLIIKDEENNVIDKLRWDGDQYCRLIYTTLDEFRPKSAKQFCAADMLSNMNIPIRIISGIAGSGKTKLTVKHGLHFLAKGTFNKIFFVRHNVSVGEPIGALPGTLLQKMRAWLGCLADNLDDYMYTIEEMVDREILEIDAVALMKGRDIKNAWIIVDEAEDLTLEQFKMLGERTSGGSVINFIGDTKQTTSDKYKKDNGMTQIIERLKGNRLVSIISFDSPEDDNFRSPASKVFTSLCG